MGYEGHHISCLILRDLSTKLRLINGICGAIERMLFSKSIGVNLDCGSIWLCVKEILRAYSTQQTGKRVYFSDPDCTEVDTWLCVDSGPHWLAIWLPGIYTKGWTHKQRCAAPLQSSAWLVLCCWSGLLKCCPSVIFLFVHLHLLLRPLSFLTWPQPCSFCHWNWT